jgi:predicted O-methyltransferase YrrM
LTRQPGLSAYDDQRRFSNRVWQAVEQTRASGFEQACIPEVGQLLALCAGFMGVMRICELGTAYGVGAAWIESGMREDASLVTVELDAVRADAARSLFADNPAVEVVTGDWSLAVDRGPFDLLFSDGGPKRNPGDPERLLPLLATSGMVVLDDYTPGYLEDVSRQIWLQNSAYRAIELTLTPTAAVILATKR